MAQDTVNTVRRPAWLFPAGAVVVAAMAICAAQLLLPGGSAALRRFLDGAGPVTGAYLAYAALLFIVGLIWPDAGRGRFEFLWAFVAGTLAQLLAGLFMLGVGIYAASFPDAAPSAVLLAIPGAFALVLCDATENRGKALDAKENVADSENANALQTWMKVIIQVAPGFAVFGALLAGFVQVFASLRLELILRQDGAMADLVARLSQAKVYLDFVVPMLLVYLGTFGVFSALSYAAVFVWRLFNGRQNRALTEAETRYVEAAIESVAAYGEAQRFERFEWLRWVQLALLLGVMIGGFFASIWLYRDLAAHAQAARIPAGPEWHIYSWETGFGLLVAVFAVIFVLVIPFSLWYRLFPRSAEALTWLEFASGRSPLGVDVILRMWLRAGRISVADRFDPGQFLRNTSKVYEPYFLWPGLVLVALTAYFWRLDLANYDLLTPERIVTVDYWTSARREHQYEDVAAVTLECAKGKSYGLRLRSGEAITVKFWKDEDARLDALTEIDERLRARGVQVAFALREPLFRDPIVDYSEECVADLVEGLPAERAAQIERILHLDDWRGRTRAGRRPSGRISPAASRQNGPLWPRRAIRR